MNSIVDQIKALWADSKIKAILLALPIIAIGVLKLAAWLVKRSADNTIQDAKDQDEALKNQIQAANDEIIKHQTKAEELAKQDPDVSEDWNKKQK